MKKIFFSNIKITQGQSLIEITVALGVLAALLTISTIAITTALQNSQSGRNQSQAGIYAKEGIEIVRQMRDTSWTTFNSLSGTYCMASTCTQLTASGVCGQKIGSCGQNAGEFSREVLIEKNSAQCSGGGNNATKATVSVFWADQKCAANDFCRVVSVESCFANLYGLPAL